MAGNDKIDISVVANLKSPVEGIDLLSQKTAELTTKLNGLQAILSKLEKVQPGKELAALLRNGGQSLQQLNAPSGRSGIDNNFIAQIQRQQERDMKNNLDKIQASMKKLTDGLAHLVKDMSDEARQASNAMADARRIRRVAEVRGRTGEQIFADQQEERRQREARRYAPLPQEAVDASVARRFQLSSGARSYMGGAPLLAERFRTFTDYAALGTSVSAVYALARGVVDLDKELRQFQAITNTSRTEMVGFERGLLNLAASSKFSAVELAGVATALGQAGLSARQVEPALDAVQKLAAASGSSLKEAQDLTTSTIGVFKVQGEEVANIANTFTSALNLSKLTMEQLTLGFQYSANIARDLGLSYTELTSILSTLANSGIRSGSMLGTGLRQLLIDLQTPTEKARATFARLGITLDDINVRSHGLTGVLENLRAKGFTTADAFSTLETRAVAAYSALSAGLDQTRRMEQQLLLSSAATEAVSVQMQGFAAQIARLYNSISTLFYRAFKPMLDVFTVVVSKTADIIGGFAKMETLIGVGGSLFGTVAMGLLVTKLVTFSSALLGIGKGYDVIATQARSAAAAAAMFAAASGSSGLVARGASLAGGLAGGAMSAFGGPVGLAVGAVAIGTSIYAATRSGQQDSADRAQAKLSEAQGQYDATTNAVARLRDEMQKLIDRQSELDRSDQARLTRILELRKAFGEFGLTLSDSARNTAELVAALQKLDRQLNERATAQNQTRIDARQVKIKELEGAYERQFQTNSRTVLNQSQRFSARFGPTGDALLRAATGIDRPGEGDYGRFYTEHIAKINDMLRAIPENERERTGQQGWDFTQLTRIKEALQQSRQHQNSVSAERLALRSDLQVQTELDYKKRLSDAGLDQQVNAIRQEAQAQLARINSETNSLKREELANTAIGNIRERFLSPILGREHLLHEMREGADPETLKRIEELAGNNDLRTALDQIVAAFKAVISGSQNITAQIKSSQINAEINRINAEISQANSRSRATNNQRTIQEMGVRVQELIQQRINKELEKLEAEKGPKSGSNTPTEIYEQLRREIQQKGEAELERAATQSSETLREANRSLFRQTEALAERQIRVLESQMRLARERARDPNATAERTRALIDEFNKLSDQREQIIRNQVERARALNPERGGFVPLPTAAPAAYATAQALGEYGSRIASLESRFNPNARNASGAYGLFQFMPTTLMGQSDGGFGGLSSKHEGFRKLLQDAGITNSEQLRQAVKEGRLTIPVQMQIELMRRFTADNRSQMGVNASDEDMALAHFMGAGGAKQLLAALANNPNAPALGNGISAVGLRNNRLAQDATVSQVRDFYLSGYRRQDISRVGISEGMIRDQALDERMAETFLKQVRESIESATDALKKAREQADQRVSQARTAIRAAQEGMSLGNASEGDVQRAQRELRQAQLARHHVELTANLEEQKRLQEAMAKIQDGEVAAAQRKEALQGALNQLVGKEKELRDEINIADRANTRTPINPAGLTQTYLQRQGFLTTKPGEVNTKGMVESGYLEMLGGLDKAFQNLFMTIATGELSFKNLANAAKAFGLSIVQTMMNIISKRLGEMLINSLFGNALGGSGTGAGGLLTGFFSMLFGAPAGMSNGGMRRAANGVGIPNRDSIPHLLMPGEAVLRSSAVSVIGEDAVTAINNQGNRKVSTPFNDEPANDNSKDGGVVNIWLVERDAMPPLSEKDIVHVIGSDLEKKGSTYQLIRQIQVGAR